MTIDSNPNDLIIVKKSDLKSALGKIFSFIYTYYIKLNSISMIIFKKIFSSSQTAQTLLSSDAIILFCNTLVFAFIGNFFQGLIGQIAFISCFLNICAFLFGKMGWVEKLNKD